MRLAVYSADRGKLLKEVEVGTAIIAAPMTYMVDGEQYIAVMAGFGGGPSGAPFPPGSAPHVFGNDGRTIAFKLGGGDVPIPEPVTESPFELPPDRTEDAQPAANGEVLFNRYCARCHPFGRAMLPDLRRMSPATHEIFAGVVLEGLYAPLGMGRFDDVLSRADAEAIHAYILHEAWSLYTRQVDGDAS
jgi:quinohemoprotein ethanol dehydrogenase